MSDATVRVASPVDVPQLAALRRDYVVEQNESSAPTGVGFHQRFDAWYQETAPVSRWRVAELGGALVGVAHMFTHFRMPKPADEAGGWGYVSLLYVRPEHRGGGLGARLLQAIEADALALGFSRVLLNPTERATPLYRRSGYEPADSFLVHHLAGGHTQ